MNRKDFQQNDNDLPFSKSQSMSWLPFYWTYLLEYTLMRDWGQMQPQLSMIKVLSSPGCSSLMRGRLAFANKKKADGDLFGAPSFCTPWGKVSYQLNSFRYISIIDSERLARTFCFTLFVAILQGPWNTAFCSLNPRFSTSDKSYQYFLWSSGRAFQAREHSFDTEDMQNFNGFNAENGGRIH